MYTVYVLQHDATNGMYIGVTSDLKKRIVAHNDNRNKSTSRREGTWHLLYAEAYRSEHDARVREKKLKQHGSSKKELFKRIANCFLETKSEAG